MCWPQPLLLLLAISCAACASVAGGVATSPAASPWSSFRSAVNQQSLQTVLLSIEERLRGLDNMYSARYTPRWEMNMEQQTRRLEAIESRLGRLETLLELRLDKVSETLSARQLKEELSRDQLSRKVDSTYERLNHRLGYMEARVDMGINKLQTSVEAGVGRTERLEVAIGGRQGEVGAEIMDVKAGIDNLKTSMQGCQQQWHNATMVAVASGESTMKVYYNHLSDTLVQIRGELNRTLVQNDGGDRDPEREEDSRAEITKVMGVIDRHATNYGTKITNMYNELWRRTQVLETLIKDSMSLSNSTRRDFQEGLRSVAVQLGYSCTQSDRSKPGSLDMTLETFASHLSDLSRKMDSYFQILISTQNVFLDSCHRIQESEPMMERRLTQVLERIIDIINNSRCTNMGQEVEEVHKLLKSHHSTVVRNVGHSTNTVMKAAEESNKETKRLEDAINGVREGLLTGGRDIHDGLMGMQEGQSGVRMALDQITASVQDLQEQMAELISAGLSSEQNEDLKKNATPSSCPDSRVIAADVAAEMSKLTAISPGSSNRTATDVKAFSDMFIAELEKKGVMIITNESQSISRCRTQSVKEPIPGAKKHYQQPSEETETQATKLVEFEQERDEDDSSDDDSEDEDEVLIEHDEHSRVAETGDRLHHHNRGGEEQPGLNISSNVSTFETSHRFDVPSTTPTQIENDPQEFEDNNSLLGLNKDPKSAEVTIKIIPNLGGGTDLFQVGNESALLEIDLNHVSAIIHSTDTDRQGQGRQASVTIVHNDKPVTAEGQVKYRASVEGVPAELVIQQKIGTDQNKTQEVENVMRWFIPVPVADNGTTDNKSISNNLMATNLTKNTSTSESPDYPVDSTTEETSTTVSTPIPETTPTTPEDVGNRTINRTNEIPLTLNTPNNTLTIDMHNTTINHTSTGDTHAVSSFEGTTRPLSNKIGYNESELDPNAINVRIDHPEISITEFVQKLIETYGHGIQTNKSVLDIWEALREKNELMYSKEVLGALDHKNRTFLHLNSNFEDHVRQSIIPKVKSQQERLINQNAGDSGGLNRVDSDIQIRHYLNKLEQLASRLSREEENSDPNVTDRNSNIIEPDLDYPTDPGTQNLTVAN